MRTQIMTGGLEMSGNLKIAEAAECTEYLYIVDGIVYEYMANVACRRAGKPERVARKQIKCPYCAECLTNVDKDTRIRLYRKPKNKTVNAF
jgi:late competence protein required for DNA uptake (superfamily II DNA/RNA helicase)